MRALLVMMAGTLLPAALSGCMAYDDGGAEPAIPPAPTCPAETKEWSAFINAMPGPDAQPTLIVTGSALVPAGTTATLTAGPTDRAMPPSQRIVLALASSPDAAGGWQQLRAEIKPALPQYRSVIVGCDGNAVATITDIQIAQ
jgi:hypothetical protein